MIDLFLTFICGLFVGLLGADLRTQRSPVQREIDEAALDHLHHRNLYD